MNDIFLMHYFL